jgi:hypothetical protein
MNTKVVYVATSSNEDWYLSQTLISVYSLRQKNQNVIVELVVDAETDKTIQGKRAAILDYIDNKIVIDVPDIYNRVQASRFIKTNLRKYVSGDYLYIDSDTIITDTLDDIDNFSDSIGMVLNVHVPIALQHDRETTRQRIRKVGWKGEEDILYFNGGLLYAKDNELTHDFYQAWHQKWKETLEKYGWHYDQPSLAVVNAEMGNPISELDGIWNCQVMVNGLPYLYKAKIIHYFANHAISRKTVDKCYLLHDKSIYEKLEKSGVFSQELKELVENAKGAFVTPNRIVAGNELELLTNRLHFFAMNYPKVYKGFNQLARLVGLVIRIKKKYVIS